MNSREVALNCLLELAETDISIATVVDNAFEKYSLSIRERRFANALVYGVVRWQRQLDWVLKHFVNSRFELDTKHRSILRLGAFQLLHLDGVSDHAAIFETVQLTKNRRKTTGFVNAVLRAVQRKAADLSYPSLETHPVEHISLSLSYPRWLVEKWIKDRGIDWTLAFCKSSNQIAGLTFRIDTSKTDQDQLIKFLLDSGMSTYPSELVPDAVVVDSFSDSPRTDIPKNTNENILKDILTREDVYVQDESAMLISHLLCPQSMDLVVDLCAAPGGKTTHIASLMGNMGKIIACDISENKIEVLQDNCKRLGVKNVEIKKVDAVKDDLSFITAADAVLIDVPCSGFGTLRRHPNILWHKTFKQLSGLVNLQFRLLKNAAKHIKPNGVLVYSTCTIEPSENERVISRFLKENRMFTVEHASQFLPDVPKSMFTSEGYLQTFPHEHGIDGAFGARLRRIQ